MDLKAAKELLEVHKTNTTNLDVTSSGLYRDILETIDNLLKAQDLVSRNECVEIFKSYCAEQCRAYATPGADCDCAAAEKRTKHKMISSKKS